MLLACMGPYVGKGGNFFFNPGGHKRTEEKPVACSIVSANLVVRLARALLFASSLTGSMGRHVSGI